MAYDSALAMRKVYGNGFTGFTASLGFMLAKIVGDHTVL